MNEAISLLKDRLQALEVPLAIGKKRERLQKLRERVTTPDFWDDQTQAVQDSAELAELERLIKQWDDLHELCSMAEVLGEGEVQELEGEVRTLERQALLSGLHDAQGCLLTIHAGTGGTDAQDWAEMLLRMYLRFVEQGSSEQTQERTLSLDRSGWQAVVVEENRGEEAGIKRAALEISGRYAYGLLKNEAGVHRLVRQSPFNAKGLRQTSFALVEVIPEIDQTEAPMLEEKELRIDVFRASGHGGQGVNTTDSAVRITHIPTGIVVSVQNERSQHQNKATALKILQSKLAHLQEIKNAEEMAILKGEIKEGSWGNQIRSYVLHPYQMVKDHRTGYETTQTQAVLNGELRGFIESNLVGSS